jgi:cytosine/adenosine deaminase-related metal-dependent hydrolase
MDPALPPVLHNAGLVIAGGAIRAIGELGELRRDFGELPTLVDHHKGVMLPGLVNAHTHLELSYQQADKLDASHFTAWVSALMSAVPPPEQLESTIRSAARRGARESLGFGVTTLGDISRHPAFTRTEYALMQKEAASPAVPRIISFGEIVAIGKSRDRIAERLETALGVSHEATGEVRTAHRQLVPGNAVIGLSPHAPYTVEGPALRAVVRAAIIHRTPVCMHLAELAEEADFLRDLSGPLGRDWELMQRLDLLDEAIPRYDGGPIRWAQRWGLLVHEPRDFPTLLAHVNYCDLGELNQLATHACSVVYCPRTHAHFRHPPHRYREMLEAQINVCLGTDSLASNPDLNILKETQLLHIRDGLLAYHALDMITRRAAAALGVSGEVGTLAPGKKADAVLFPGEVAPGATADALAQALLRDVPAPAAVFVDGLRVQI